MSKFLTTLIAAGVGLGVNAAIAQNVTSEGERAQGQEQLMQKKEEGASTQSQNGARERRSQDYERTETNQSSGNQGSSNSSGGNAGSDSGTAQREHMDQSGHSEHGSNTKPR